MENKHTSRLYEFFTPVKESTRLGKLFNRVFKTLELMRSMSAPATITVDGWDNPDKALLFYEMCLTEQYLHSIIDNLEEWKAVAGKYNNEFHGSWKYYAMSRRIEGIREYGGEDYDYNEDGSIKTDVSDSILMEDTVLYELLNPHCNSIFISTLPDDCLKICSLILNAGGGDIMEIFRKMGKPIQTYRLENGKIILNDWMDEALQKAEKQLIQEEMAVFFYNTLLAIRQLIDEIEKLPPTEDNKEFFMALPQRIQDILDLRVPVITMPGTPSEDAR